jgi:hypothetical protein
MDTAIPLSPNQRPPHPSRDQAIVDFIGRHGVVTIDHVIEALGLTRTTAYRRTAACVEGRLLERFQFLNLEPSLLRATRRGLRYAGLALKPARVSFASIDHRLRSASTAQLLAQEFDPSQILSERQLIHAERLEGKPLFSARLSKSRLHRPDLAVQTDDQTIAAEVELSPKNPRRLEAIMRAWKEAAWVTEVRYYVQSGATRRGVERAIQRAEASDRIHIFEAPPR